MTSPLKAVVPFIFGVIRRRLVLEETVVGTKASGEPKKDASSVAVTKDNPAPTAQESVSLVEGDGKEVLKAEASQ